MTKLRLLLILTTTLSYAPVVSAKSLVVISGGYQSCPKNGDFIRLPHAPLISTIVEAAAPLVSGLKTLGDDVDVIWSCYSGVKKHPLGEMVKGSPMSFGYGQGKPGEASTSIEVSSNTIDDAKPLSPFFDYVERYADMTKPDHIYLAGHSYGGWTAMHLGVHLAKTGHNVSGITTFDPISPFQCPAGILSSSFVVSAQAPAGCLMAPRDLVEADMDLLRQENGLLVNFYQTTFTRLHASVLKYPGWSNRLVQQDYRRVWFGDTHTSMVRMAELWRDVFQLIQASRH